ncbi:MAG: hypothetical protein V4732_10470 [Pseudomonadota bacterium]
MNVDCEKLESRITEDLNSMVILEASKRGSNTDVIIDALRQDQVVLVQGLIAHEADNLIHDVAHQLDLIESLTLQSAFASSLGHRENIGKYFMSVNKRDDYQFIAPHSEGGSFTNMQLASFYCYENSSDGGETILMNVDQDCKIWSLLREKVKRGKSKRDLTPTEIQKIRLMARLNMPEDILRGDDEILNKTEVDPNFTVYEVLAKPVKTYSKILGKHLYVYWDNIESNDYDSAEEFYRLLKQSNLIKLPENGLKIDLLDDSANRRVRRFGSKYAQIFKRKITRKLLPGELIIINNMTWCHSVNNWTPGSGIRKVAAAFA